MTTMFHRTTYLQGLTLLELMIALTIALFLLGGTSAFYLLNKASYKIESALARMDENGRFLTYYLTNQLTQADNYGCLTKGVAPNSIVSDALMNFNPGGLRGYDGLSNSFSPALPTSVTGTPIANSDVISISGGLTSDIMVVNADMNNLTSPLSFNNGTVFVSAGTAVVVTDCNVADLFIASSGTNASSITHLTDNNTTASLSTTYPIGAQAFRYHSSSYYVQNSGRVNSANQPIFSLIQEDLNHNISEIAEGVERIQILYAVNSDTLPGPNGYQTATEVEASNNWSNVVGLQISLLLSSNENVISTPQSYYFNGETITPTDMKIRRQWDIFVALRIPGVLL